MIKPSRGAHFCGEGSLPELSSMKARLHVSPGPSEFRVTPKHRNLTYIKSPNLCVCT
jgi:hypothetical protein